MSAQNGDARPLTEQLKQARLAVKLERARAELTSIRANHFTATRLLQEGYDGYTGYAWGDLVDPMDAFRDADLQRGFPFLDKGYARRDGYNRPFLWSDLDLDLARSTARWLATKNKLAVGALTTLRNFTVRTGFKYDAKPKEGCEGDAAVQALCDHLNLFLDEHHRVNAWANREASACWRACRDGEHGLRHFPQPDGMTWVRPVEPETVYQPLGSPLDWTWGVRTDPDDVERPLEYAVHYRGPDGDADFVREDDEGLPGCEAGMTWLKRNVDECVKRGLPDFYCTGEALDSANKLLRNMLASGGVQSAIAWIQQYKAATGSTVQQQIQQSRDQNRTYYNQPVTGQVVNYQKYEPGSIPKVGAGMEYLPPPIPVGASIHIQMVQAALRAIGARWCMPEYMISGDASNANYASTMVSGSPFVTAIECEQELAFKPFFLRSHWVAVRVWCRARKCVAGGRPWSYEDVRRVVEIHATAPQVAIANKEGDATVDHGDLDRGVLSVQERQRRLGLDPAKMKQEIAEEPPKKPAGASSSPAGGGAGNGAAPPSGAGPFGESLDDRLARLRERYDAGTVTRVVNGAARLLEDAQRTPPAAPPAEPPAPVVIDVQTSAPPAPPAAPPPRQPVAWVTENVQRDPHGRIVSFSRRAVLEDTQDAMGRWHDARGHLVKHGGGAAGGGKDPGPHPLDGPAKELSRHPEGRKLLARGRQLAAHVGGHVRGAVTAGVRKAIDGLDEESRNGASLLLGGIKSRSPAAVAAGVGQLVSMVYENIHQEVYELAMSDHSIPGAHLVGKTGGKALAAGEKALLKAVAWAMHRGKRALGLAESVAPSAGELSKLDRAMLHAAAEAAVESVRHLYEQAGVPAELAPSAEQMAARLHKSLLQRAKGG